MHQPATSPPAAASLPLVDTDSPAAPETPILLETTWVGLAIDVLGAVALFTTLAVAASPRDAALITGVIGVSVVACRVARMYRDRQSPPSNGADQVRSGHFVQ